MGWDNIPAFSINEAAQRGVDVYEVIVSDWSFFDYDPSSTTVANQWPPAGDPGVPLSVAGIAIGPRSTIDRCFISYDLQKRSIQPNVDATDRMRRLSVDSPLIFTQASPAVNLPPDLNTLPPLDIQYRQGTLFAAAYVNTPDGYTYLSGPVDSTVMPETYVDVNGVTRGFDGRDDSSNPALAPLLHLLIYLKAPTAFIPTKRFPLIIKGAWRETPADNTEIILAQIPTYGRRSLRLAVTTKPGTGGGTFDVRVGGLRALATLNNYEEPVDSILAQPAGTTVVFEPCVGQDVCLDYVNVYLTAHGSVGEALFTFTATD